MKSGNKFYQSVLVTSLLVSLGACSHGTSIPEFPNTAHPGEEYRRLESDLAKGEENQLDVLSPHNFKKAQRGLENARKSLERQKPPEETLHQIAEGREYLNRSNDVASLAQVYMGEVITARQQAIQAGAPHSLPDEFNRADRKLTDITSDLENNDFKPATEKRGALQAKYLDLELKAIQHAFLGAPRKTLEQAIDEGAKDYAPHSLRVAEKDMADSQAYIIANRHHTEEIRERANKAWASADHLLKITRQAKFGQKLPPEELALKLEREQQLVQDKQLQLNQERQARRSLTEEKKNLEAETNLHRIFEEASKEFTANEAEVFKQGDTLLVRLKSLEFPTGKDSLKSSNFPVLSKVQKVIKKFGPAEVTVEGHTDSQGSKAVNRKLSLHRAMTVKEYLSSLPEMESYRMKAVGWDYRKPAADNKTADGRAQNRRVDVLIRPDAASKVN